jgi:Tol biopolymer transport system component
MYERGPRNEVGPDAPRRDAAVESPDDASQPDPSGTSPRVDASPRAAADWWILAAALAFVLLTVAGVNEERRLAWSWLNAAAGGDSAWTTMIPARLTDTGNVACAAISPDGKYVVYGVVNNSRESSLWIRQVGTLAGQAIVPPSPVHCLGVTVSPDGEYVYYVWKRHEDALATLSRVPILGGAGTNVLTDVDSRVSFSPDGARMVFRRQFRARREAGLIVAGSDGRNQRAVAAMPYPEDFGDPAWSPDGRTIAAAAGHADGGRNRYLALIDVADGSMRTLSRRKWRWIGQVEWLAGATGLVMIAEEGVSGYGIWHVSYPDGRARPVARDGGRYSRLSLSADSRLLMALEQKLLARVSLLPSTQPGTDRPVAFGAGGYRSNLAWTPDGRIVYEAQLGNAPQMAIMDADGTNTRYLTVDLSGRAVMGSPAVTPDGRTIVFALDLEGTRNLWKMNLDGSGLVQLTRGNGEDHPVVSPDGRWVVYTDIGSARPSLWKLPVDGGRPERVTDASCRSPSLSPDGGSIACLLSETGSDLNLAVFPFDGGPPLDIFPGPRPGASIVRWTPDGRFLTYAENGIGGSKIWLQPVNGEQRRLLAAFENEKVFGFDWSPDGKWLACIRGFWSGNVVLLTDSERQPQVTRGDSGDERRHYLIDTEAVHPGAMTTQRLEPDAAQSIPADHSRRIGSRRETCGPEPQQADTCQQPPPDLEPLRGNTPPVYSLDVVLAACEPAVRLAPDTTPVTDAAESNESAADCDGDRHVIPEEADRDADNGVEQQRERNDDEPTEYAPSGVHRTPSRDREAGLAVECEVHRKVIQARAEAPGEREQQEPCSEPQRRESGPFADGRAHQDACIDADTQKHLVGIDRVVAKPKEPRKRQRRVRASRHGHRTAVTSSKAMPSIPTVSATSARLKAGQKRRHT